MTTSFLDQPLGRFLDLVAAAEPAPGGGAVSAVTVAAAAGLVAMAARFSGGKLDGSRQLAGRADELRHQAFALAGQDSQAYTAVLAAYRLPREPDAEGRSAQIALALLGATEVPLEVAEVAAQVAGLGQRLAEAGNPNLKGDALTAIYLAEAAARAAARLIRANAELGKLGLDLPDRADGCVRAAARARERAEAVGPTDTRTGQRGVGREHATRAAGVHLPERVMTTPPAPRATP